MVITYDYYRIFYYVAKYKSFTQAADVLMNNQPNITRTIKNLEHALGCSLFIRSNRGVRLTPEGERLYAHVSLAFEQLREGEEELISEKSLESGTVSISASETALHELLLSVLKQYHHKYPGIKIHISNHSTPQAVAALKNGQVDLAVVTTPTGVTGRPIRERRLRTFREMAVCGPSMASLTSKALHLSDLSEYPLICLGRETKTFEFYHYFYALHGLDMNPDIEAATMDQVLPMVKYDLGIGFAPEAFAAPAIEAGEIFALNIIEEIPPRSICLLERSDRSLGFAAKELSKMLAKAGE